MCSSVVDRVCRNVVDAAAVVVVVVSVTGAVVYSTDNVILGNMYE